MVKIEIVCDGRVLKEYWVSDPLGPRRVVGANKGDDLEIRLRNSHQGPVAVRVFLNGREQRPGTIGVYPWRLAQGREKILAPRKRFGKTACKISITIFWHRLYDPQTVMLEIWPWEVLKAKLQEDYPNRNDFPRFAE